MLAISAATIALAGCLPSGAEDNCVDAGDVWDERSETCVTDDREQQRLVACQQRDRVYDVKRRLCTNERR